ncbi:hypothetical protein Pelo_8238 [Pelomyxa schiedti]|nr:hypothetical protein Pelo_8238 [Pelomyxa schiedti]
MPGQSGTCGRGGLLLLKPNHQTSGRSDRYQLYPDFPSCLAAIEGQILARTVTATACIENLDHVQVYTITLEFCLKGVVPPFKIRVNVRHFTVTKRPAIPVYVRPTV